MEKTRDSIQKMSEIIQNKEPVIKSPPNLMFDSKQEVRNDERSESAFENEIDFGPFPWKQKLVLVPKKISVRNSKCNSSKPGKNEPKEYKLGVRLTCSSRDAEKYVKNVQSQIAKFPNHMEPASVKSVLLPDIKKNQNQRKCVKILSRQTS